jgi:hypothetical protein
VARIEDEKLHLSTLTHWHARVHLSLATLHRDVWLDLPLERQLDRFFRVVLGPVDSAR